MNDSPITFFIPLGNDRSNAGLTVRAENIDELQAILSDLLNSADPSDPDSTAKVNDLLDQVLTIKASLELKGLNTASVSQNKTQVTHPQAQASPSDAPSCAHGAMTWKEGVSKAGNNYKGWFCPAPYGQTKCPAKFVK